MKVCLGLALDDSFQVVLSRCLFYKVINLPATFYDTEIQSLVSILASALFV